ncbi:MAG: helix-turn-helix transcriptional regulator [Anaerolineales bacterium]
MCPMTAAPLDLEWSLLGFLRQEPTHGYELHRRLSRSRGLGLVWHLKQSQLYALLAKLEEQGYVDHTLEPQASRPPRKVYDLTEAGRQALLEWVQAPVEHGREFRQEFLAKLYFARREGEEVVHRLLAGQRAVCRRWLEEQNEAEALREERPYEWLVFEFRTGQIRAMLEWLETCETALLPSEYEE